MLTVRISLFVKKYKYNKEKKNMIKKLIKLTLYLVLFVGFMTTVFAKVDTVASGIHINADGSYNYWWIEDKEGKVKITEWIGPDGEKHLGNGHFIPPPPPTGRLITDELSVVDTSRINELMVASFSSDAIIFNLTNKGILEYDANEGRLEIVNATDGNIIFTTTCEGGNRLKYLDLRPIVSHDGNYFILCKDKSKILASTQFIKVNSQFLLSK